MIAQALTFLADVLEQHNRNRFLLEEPSVIVNGLIEANGTVPEQNRNKVVLTLLCLDQAAGGSATDAPTAADYSWTLLLSACFDDYGESLKFLDAALAFFEACPVLTSAAFPSMPEPLTQLEMLPEKMDFGKTHALWSALGARYQPSRVYRVRGRTLPVLPKS